MAQQGPQLNTNRYNYTGTLLKRSIYPFALDSRCLFVIWYCQVNLYKDYSSKNTLEPQGTQSELFVLPLFKKVYLSIYFTVKTSSKEPFGQEIRNLICNINTLRTSADFVLKLKYVPFSHNFTSKLRSTT